MKKFFLVLSLAVLSMAGTKAQSLTVFIHDSDGPFSNVRNAPNGKIVDRIPTDKNAMLDVYAPVNGWCMWEQAGEILGTAGLPRYEISNYARPGFESLHNSNVWHGQTYLGLGPAACSFDGIDRWTQVSDLQAWLNGAPPDFDRIPRRARLGEILMMGLRTVRGWTKQEFEVAAGCDWDVFSEQLNDLAERGLVTLADDAVAPTERGLAFWNDVAESLVFAP